MFFLRSKKTHRKTLLQLQYGKDDINAKILNESIVKLLSVFGVLSVLVRMQNWLGQCNAVQYLFIFNDVC